MAASLVTVQHDFSAGELDPSVKRDDDNPVVRAGGRQMANWRILNSKKIRNRPGRRALFPPAAGSRVDEVQVSASLTYRLVFGGNGSLVIRDSSGTSVASQPAGTYPWASATVKDIRWDKVKIGAAQVDVVICFPGMKPRIASFDGVSTWTFSTFAFQTGNDGIAMVPYYRIAAPGITMVPSATSGAVTVTFSAAVLNASHVGAIFRFANRRLQITGYTNPTTGAATTLETLPASQNLTMGSSLTTYPIFSVGDVVADSIARGVVTAVNLGPNTLTVQLLEFGLSFTTDTLVGPNGSMLITGVGALSAPQAVTVWDEQIVSDARGWPQSVFADQNRLGFCDLPGVPAAILWSSLNGNYNFEIGANPDDAIAELAPDLSRVYNVVPGAESSEIVFTDKGVYYIPISPTNPLKPGSVGFQNISKDACAAVRPQAVQEFIVYLTAGLNRVMAVMASGAYYRPYVTDSLADLHTHLLNAPIAIAAPNSTGTFAERYIYLLNANGTLAVGKYSVKNGNVDGMIGWVPWSGGGTIGWVSALGSTVLFTGTYAPNGISAVTITESLDDTLYLDAGMAVNAAPGSLAPPFGKGPLWWLAGGTVDLMDGTNGRRMMGTYTIDADGFIVPQGNGGEDLSSANLIAGQAWTATFEPFVPGASGGQDVGQRMWPRRILRAQVHVQESTGFVMKRMYSGQSGASLPAAGTVMAQRRISAWNLGDDATQEPTLREQSYHQNPLGTSHDPRWAIVKDTPGPLTLLEVDLKVTI